MTKGILIGVASVALLLAACGGGDSSESGAGGDVMLDNGMTVRGQIEARQAGFKKMGAATKTVVDQIRSDAPDITEIQAAATTIKEQAVKIGGWFPAGTGPEAGVKTEALAKIWEDSEGFSAVLDKFKAAAGEFDAVAQSGDAAAIGAAFQALGGSCKSCHDSYRLDD